MGARRSSNRKPEDGTDPTRSPQANSSTRDAAPVWDSTTGQLWYRRKLQYARGHKQAKLIEIVLDGLQAAQWAPSIPNPPAAKCNRRPCDEDRHSE